MGGGRLSGLCLNRISTHARTPSESKPIAEGPRSSAKAEEDHQAEEKENWGKSEAGRKIMIVVDSSPEAKRAVLWALSHTVQDHDTIVLLHVVPVSKLPKQSESDDREEPKRQIDLRDYEVPNALKTLCNSRRPEDDAAMRRRMTGGGGGAGGGGQGEGPCHRLPGQKTGGFSAGSRPTEAFGSMETADHLGGREGEGRRGGGIGGVLHSERRVHDGGGEKEEQASGRVHHHHQTPEEFLAFGLAFGPSFDSCEVWNLKYDIWGVCFATDLQSLMLEGCFATAIVILDCLYYYRLCAFYIF